MIGTINNGLVSDGGDGQFEWLRFPLPESARLLEAKEFKEASDRTISSIGSALGEVGLSSLRLELLEDQNFN